MDQMDRHPLHHLMITGNESLRFLTIMVVYTLYSMILCCLFRGYDGQRFGPGGRGPNDQYNNFHGGPGSQQGYGYPGGAGYQGGQGKGPGMFPGQKGPGYPNSPYQGKMPMFPLYFVFMRIACTFHHS